MQREDKWTYDRVWNSSRNISGTIAQYFLPDLDLTGRRQWGVVFFPDEESLHKPEKWEVTEGSGHRKSTQRGRTDPEQNLYLTYPWHQPHGGLENKRAKLLLFIQNNGLSYSNPRSQSPRFSTVDGQVGSLCSPLHIGQFLWGYIKILRLFGV